MDPRIDRTKRLVCRAALEELAAVGYGSFAIESVAARCGVARSTIYRHWPDKLALIGEAFETLNRQPPPAAPDAAEPARERIHRLLSHLAEVMAGSIFSACLPALVDAAERQPDLAEFHHRFNDGRRRALVEAIETGRASGEIDASVDPELAALALAGAIVYRRLMTGEPFDPADVDALAATVLGTPEGSSVR